MTSPALRCATVQVPNGDLQIASYLVTPTDSGSYPLVIVLQEIFGVNPHIREVTERIAAEGFVAIAPALFQRTAPNFEVGYSMEETLQARVYKDQTTAAELLSDIQAAIAYARSVPMVKSDAIGCIGFCFGGHVAYLAATLPEILATACFYGGGITSFTPGGGEPTISRTPEIHGTIYAFFGTEDPLIPVEQIDQVEAALIQHQIDHRLFRYTAGHGFFCDHRADYHPAAAADAWEHVKELFNRTLIDE